MSWVVGGSRGYMSWEKKINKIKINIKRSCEIHETKISILFKVVEIQVWNQVPRDCLNIKH